MRAYINQINYLFVLSKIKSKASDLYVYINVQSFEKPKLIHYQDVLLNYYHYTNKNLQV